MHERIELFQNLMKELGMQPIPQSFIGGELISGVGENITLEDPFANVTLTEYADCGAALSAMACERALEAQRQWVTQYSAAERGVAMQNIAQGIERRAETLAKLESLVAGKPIRDCRVEVSKVVEMFRYYAGWADKLHGEVIPVPSGHLNYTVREPLGVVFQITPWNAPAFTAGWQIAPALATGNAVVIKPSELTPVTTVALGLIIDSIGVPKGLVNVLAGLGVTAGSEAIAHDAISKVIFVGSPATGRLVATAAGQALKPVVLELGGKSANIVFSDAHLPAACKGAQAAIFSAAGQSCVAGSRLLVQESVKEKFVAMVEEGMNKLTLGDPLDNDTEVGPISNANQYQHVNTMVEEVESDKNALAIAAKNTTNTGYFVPPTILTGLNENHRALNEEVFGPVLSCLTFSDEEEAIQLANATNFGLAGAVWTIDGAKAHRVAHHVRAGTFWINSYKAIHVSSPFGGSLSSGFGRSSGTDALMEYTAPKSVWVDTGVVPTIAFGYADGV